MSLLRIGEHQLEYAWHGPSPTEKSTLVFLHGGLGCLAGWGDFPARVADSVGCGALVYSRAGYGQSDAAALPRPVRFMHDEALIVLPQILSALDIRDAILVGHSDGGSIAMIYAGSTQAQRFSGLVLEAPHVFVEEITIESAKSAAQKYREGELRSRLERYHGQNTDCAFWGWNQVWLSPEFRSWNIEEYLPQIRVPLLLLQGENDEYGTLRQIEAIENGCRGYVRSEILSDCGHSPHRHKPLETMNSMTSFLKQQVLNRREDLL